MRGCNNVVSPTNRPAFRFLLVVLLLAVFIPRQIRGQEGARPRVDPVMLAFSKAIKGLDNGLARGDTRAVLSHARALNKVAEAAIPDLEPRANKDLIHLFDEHLAKTSSLAAELVTLADSSDLAAASQVVKEIRHTCISCHVRFGNDPYGFFPSRANIITGEVEILKLDGKKRSDRSNAVVFLDRVHSDTGYPLPWKNPVFSQQSRSFTPRVLPVMKGTTIDFPNDDTIFHNVFSFSRTRPFDLDIYPPGEIRSVEFPWTGWVKVYCNIHPHMIAHIIVLDNPFFDLTDPKGNFVISGVPDGKYALRVWHEFGKEVRQQIEVSDAVLHRYSLKIQEDRKFVQHRNKFGKPYKGPYR